jgi:hypothetical protein
MLKLFNWQRGSLLTFIRLDIAGVARSEKKYELEIKRLGSRADEGLESHFRGQKKTSPAALKFSF